MTLQPVTVVLWFQSGTLIDKKCAVNKQDILSVEINIFLPDRRCDITHINDGDSAVGIDQ